MGYKSIGRLIQLAREEAGLSQEQLALRIGCSQSTLSNYEKGKRRLYLAQLEKIADELQKPMEYFMQPLTENLAGAEGETIPDREEDASTVTKALDRLSPEGRKLALDFIKWLHQREEKNNA
ncbi:MAG: helix-turn-helix domain-containing protein [Desulfocucumaceae bacterium]